VVLFVAITFGISDLGCGAASVHEELSACARSLSARDGSIRSQSQLLFNSLHKNASEAITPAEQQATHHLSGVRQIM
jgi:hypothetical protein